jgi:dihydroxyacetone kinase DhaKLM complex PTS-EIIA-like component DhaM
MEKYKTKEGVELSIGSMTEVGKIGSEMNIVQEVVEEAIKILNMYDRNCKISMGMAMSNTKKFLRSNFDIEKES